MQVTFLMTVTEDCIWLHYKASGMIESLLDGDYGYSDDCKEQTHGIYAPLVSVFSFSVTILNLGSNCSQEYVTVRMRHHFLLLIHFIAPDNICRYDAEFFSKLALLNHKILLHK